jgi:biopolymer transport protein TolR
MGISLGSSRHAVLAEMNVVPLIDILLVLLIIFMVISPRVPVGLGVALPAQSTEQAPGTPPDVIVVQVLADGSLRINSDRVLWRDLQGRLEEIYKARASRVAFVRGDNVLEFGAVARAIDLMRGAGITTVGLMTPELENAR